MGPGLIALAANLVPLVTHGAGDPADPAVVAIVDSTGVTACSGTVIDSHFVLTAAHCIVPQIAHGARVVVGSSATSPTASVPLAASRVHPAYDPSTFADDVALLVLASAAPVAPVPLGLAAPSVGSTVKVVGWGETTASAGDFGTKRTGIAIVAGVDALDFHVAPDPSLPCTGDSGGPALAMQGGAQSIVGITSHGDTACSTEAFYTRVDVVASNFVSPTMASLAEGTARPGARCLYPEQCAGGAGACVVAADEAELAFCTEDCSVNADCPTGMQCVGVQPSGSQCRYPVPSPGAFGGACVMDADCVAGVCESAVCTVRCVPSNAMCPAGSACQEQGTGIDFFCVLQPPPQSTTGSSCAVASQPDRGPGALATLIATIGLVFGARRRRARW